MHELGNGKRGKHMDEYAFRNACHLASNTGSEYITLGGGEPTLHPKFRRFVEIGLDFGLQVFLVTNGSRQHQIQWLINQQDLYGYDKINFEVSIDDFHDGSLVEPWVYNWAKNSHRSRARNTQQRLLPLGRAKDLLVNSRGYSFNWAPDYAKTACICDSLTVKVDGTLQFCGCKDSHVYGNVVDDRCWPNRMPRCDGELCWQQLTQRQKECVLGQRDWDEEEEEEETPAMTA
jgi:hypothetical protein